MLLGRWRGALVAVKVLKQTSLQRSNTAALNDFRQEADMLQRLRHPNILNFYGACFDCQPVCASSANIVCMSVRATIDVRTVLELSFCMCVWELQCWHSITCNTCTPCNMHARLSASKHRCSTNSY